jgi:ribosome recycling factor
MVEETLKIAEERMQKSLKSFQSELAKIRTGRANPSLLENIRVPYYGNEVPLNQVASISVDDPQTLLVVPWEKTLVPVIEKAILQSNLGLNPVTAGQNIRVPLPPMTEERRKELVKLIRQTTENARVVIRNIRRDVNAQFKANLKEKVLSEDDARRAEERNQKLTDRYISEIEAALAKKETDLLSI